MLIGINITHYPSNHAPLFWSYSYLNTTNSNQAYSYSLFQGKFTVYSPLVSHIFNSPPQSQFPFALKWTETVYNIFTCIFLVAALIADGTMYVPHKRLVANSFIQIHKIWKHNVPLLSRALIGTYYVLLFDFLLSDMIVLGIMSKPVF